MPRSKPPRRKPRPPDPARPLLQAMSANGLIVGGGLVAYERMTGRTMDQPTADAFMAGCAYIFGVMTRMHDDGPEDDPGMPSDADLERMERLADEMEQIDRRQRLQFGKPMGSA